MIFNPKKLTLKEGFFRIPKDATAQAHECLRCDIIKEFWHNFTFTTSELNMSQTAGFSFALGDFEPLPLSGNIGQFFSCQGDLQGVVLVQFKGVHQQQEYFCKALTYRLLCDVG